MISDFDNFNIARIKFGIYVHLCLRCGLASQNDESIGELRSLSQGRASVSFIQTNKLCRLIFHLLFRGDARPRLEVHLRRLTAVSIGDFVVARAPEWLLLSVHTDLWASLESETMRSTMVNKIGEFGKIWLKVSAFPNQGLSHPYV